MQDCIKMSAEEAENLRRQHVKHELMDYRHYRSRAEWLEEKIARLDHKLSGEVSALPMGEMGGLSSITARDSWITTAMAEQDKLLKEKEIVDYHVDLVETWLSCLDDKHYDVLHLYVILNNCTKLEDCSKELGYAYKRGLLIDVEVAITQILEKN